MSLDPRISLITLGVEDVARATEFYGRLGWKKSAASQDAVTFIQLKGTVLALFSRQSLADDARVENTPSGFSGVTLAHNVASERGVDAVYKFALSCGATPVNGLLLAAQEHGLQAQQLDLRNSGDTAGDKSRVVGYGAFAFFEPAQDKHRHVH